MPDERPDVFGPYQAQMHAIHWALLKGIAKRIGLDIGALQLPIHQSSWFEYIDMKHDDGFAFHAYAMTFPQFASAPSRQTRGMILAVSTAHESLLFSGRTVDQFVSLDLGSIWSGVTETRLTPTGRSQAPAAGSNDVVQTIHCFHGPDQLFKVIYFRETLLPVFAALGDWRPSSLHP